MNSVLSINERATEHCAQMTPSDLVEVWSPPDVDGSYHESPTSSKAPSTDQRCFRYVDCFDGVSALVGQNWIRLSVGSFSQIVRVLRGTFKAVYLSSQFDRKTDCFDGGEMLLGVAPLSLKVRTGVEVGKNVHAAGVSCAAVNPAITFKAVCGTQTRQVSA